MLLYMLVVNLSALSHGELTDENFSM